MSTTPTSDTTPTRVMARIRNTTRWKKAGSLGAAALMAITLGTVATNPPGTALGPVVAITPYEVTANGFVGYVFNGGLSGRGEAAGVYDAEMQENAFVFLDSPGPEPLQSGLGIAVSDDSCVALWARYNGSTNGAEAVSIGITDRCRGFERELLRTNANYQYGGSMALSANGRFGVAVLPPPWASEFQPNSVVRIDTETGALDFVPPHGFPYFGWDPYLGVDISDDGSVVVAVEAGSGASTTATFMRDVVAWQVGTPEAIFVSGPAATVGAAGFPSISGNARYVSFASTRPMGAGESGAGPWVYVADRIGGGLRLVSPAGGAAYHSSLSNDATQVAYTVGPAARLCQFNRQNFEGVEDGCPGVRIDVAYGPAPGFTAPFATETVSILANGSQGGFHVEPRLSGNGRWVSWISTAGQALLGSNDENLNYRHAYTRRRDPGLVVDPIDFGTIAANSSSTLATTVRNTGRTSVSLDSITATPNGRFVVESGGTCVGGSVLPPAATCTVNVRFVAPNNTSESTGSITVAEAGNVYDPISAAGRLIGRSSFNPPPTTTTTTLPTGTPTTTTRPPRVTTTTTTPGQVILTADPSPMDFGPVAVGIGSPIMTLTVTNIGTGSGQLLTELEGDHPADFYVARNGCNETVLAPDESCTMDIMMIPLEGGIRTALLTLSAGGVSGGVDLLGEGHFAPQLLASPAAITTNGITTIIGRGFPPGGTFSVKIGDTGEVIDATADDKGVFRIPYSAFRKLTLGNYVLQVDPLPNVFELVRGQLVVVLPTFEPQGPGGPAFGDALIVTRGGGS